MKNKLNPPIELYQLLFNFIKICLTKNTFTCHQTCRSVSVFRVLVRRTHTDGHFARRMDGHGRFFTRTDGHGRLFSKTDGRTRKKIFSHGEPVRLRPCDQNTEHGHGTDIPPGK